MRIRKKLFGLALLLLLVPAVSANAAASGDTAAKNNAQPPFSALNVNTLAFTNSWTANLEAGNIRLGGAFSNTSSTNYTSMYFDLYRVTATGDVYVGSNHVNINPGQTVGGYYHLAYNQPAGLYKVVLNSSYAITSGVSLGNY
ncbi:hypothetical protein [Paenibacillus luteus]|uniref:hypothetical protein n=1 Tax=Paenibacillus luteus TaxID=2545753 RepID=UPI001144E1B9|nr:hypothetical protein [Paenibacillus luteus]